MNNFKQTVLRSGFIHKPLPLERTHSFEKRKLEKEEILTSREVVDSYHKWFHSGRGKIEHTQHSVTLHSATRYDSWDEGAPADGDYVDFGEVRASLFLSNEDWQDYNQLKLDISADCRNVVNPSLTLTLTNDGAIKIPDIYDREGTHVINLEGQEKRTYVLDISNLPRECITGFSIYTSANGSYMNLQGDFRYTIENIRIEKNKCASSAKGWRAPQNEIVFSHIGYHPAYTKTAIINEDELDEELFELVNSRNNQLSYQGQIQRRKTTIGSFGVLDFSKVKTSGSYYLQVGERRTEVFSIGTTGILKEDSIWKALNFIFCERCGCPVHGIHGTCHEDLVVEYKQSLVSFNGGWHDAGDLSQQLVQTAEVTASLFELAEMQKENEALYLRLLEEGEWGLDFILKTRLDDGDRITSAGMTRWTDNRIGNMDDATPRIHNSPYDNFLITGLLTKIIMTLPKDYQLRPQLIQVVKEDYQHALSGFQKTGFQHEPIFWEHTYNTSKSLFLATMSWTAALMYQLTNDQTYREQMQQWFAALLECQESTGISLYDGTSLKGMFYRDESHQVFQHFNHQAREHLYAQAFEEVLAVADKAQWHQAAADYADYLAFLSTFTAPYPMYASGIYQEDEWLDEESFNKQHLLVDEEAKESYQKQLKQGIKIADGIYIKRFPVWFSFRGNNGILLSMGKSAGIMGGIMNQTRLLDLADQQLQWMIGKNPFGQSMMYGEGYNYPQQYSVSSGEITGEMPVGIQTFGDEDAPYWPQFNNATYKEVWVGIAGKWLGVISELIKYEDRGA